MWATTLALLLPVNRGLLQRVLEHGRLPRVLLEQGERGHVLPQEPQGRHHQQGRRHLRPSEGQPGVPSCALELNVDYVGNDIGNAPSSDPYACCSKCMAKSGCNAFSWSDLNGGTCWFKSTKGTTAAKTGIKSAIV